MTVEELLIVMRHRIAAANDTLWTPNDQVNMWLDCLQALEMLAGIPQASVEED